MGNVFVQTNAADGNHIIAFERGEDGSLSQRSAVPTGGKGDGVPHLASQGSVVLAGDATRLLVANAGSGDLSVFDVSNEPSLLQVVPTGPAPKSIAEVGGLVYVLNTGAPSLTGFRLTDAGLEPIEDSLRELAPDADPAQIGFSPDGSTLVVTERGTDSIVSYSVSDGLLGEPERSASAGPTPYGFTFAADGVLVVTEAFGAAKGKAAASSYRLAGSSAQPISRSIGNGRSEICWAVATADGRYVFTTNFADGAVSRYAVGQDGVLTLEDAAAGAAIEGQSGLRDEGLSSDGQFLYAIDSDAGRVFGWSVEDGRLSALGSWNGVPATVAGLAAS
jgi:6-phosphogluconolactonase